MISLSRGIAFGPKMFSGGISNVTRQYDGKRRSSRICSVVNVLSVLFIVCTHDLFVSSRSGLAGLSHRNAASALVIITAQLNDVATGSTPTASAIWKVFAARA